MERMSNDFYFLNIAKAVSEGSTCITKHYGSVIVDRNNHIVSTGYNGSPKGCINCCDTGKCIRLEQKVKRGTNYAEGCVSVHSEQNAISQGDKNAMYHGTLYLYGYDVVQDCVVKNPNCCAICKRLVINAGIDTVVVADPEIGIPPKDETKCPYRARIINVNDWKNIEAITSAY